MEFAEFEKETKFLFESDPLNFQLTLKTAKDQITGDVKITAKSRVSSSGKQVKTVITESSTVKKLGKLTQWLLTKQAS
jgi:hypothetical protein